MPVQTFQLGQFGEAFDLLQLHRLAPRRYPYLLQSVLHGTPQARYDILFAFPGQQITTEAAAPEPFLTRLDYHWREAGGGEKTDTSTLPFRGGWFLYLGYELAGEIELSLQLSQPTGKLPTAFATRIPAAFVIDHEGECLHLVDEGGEGGEERLSLMLADLEKIEATPSVAAAPHVLSMREDAPQRYLNGVARIKQYIIEGDVFQVNLSRQWNLALDEAVTASQLYERLRDHNPAPFAALVEYGDCAVISSSPERLIEVRGRRISTRPIAGTRPRSEDADADKHYSRSLLRHPKEQAEHVMLLDLERNDLGRVCRPGSVEVDELMTLESYAHVHHIVSNVRGTLRQGISPGQAIGAVFPGGTITGCPKVRCMEIIQELEQTARGPYTGSLGYLNHNGEMDLNILIRTMYKEGAQLSFRTGAGIVADSIPQRELQETRTKAKGLLRALGVDGEISD